MQIGQSDPETSAGLHVFDPERDNPPQQRSLHDGCTKFEKIRSILGWLLFDGVRNLVIQCLARPHVSRGDPAPCATAFQLADDFHRGVPILGDMTDEQKKVLFF